MEPDKLVQVVDLSRFYWLIGALIVMNFASIITIVTYAAKAVWWLSRLDSRVQSNSKDVGNAHKAIKELKEWHLIQHGKK